MSLVIVGGFCIRFVLLLFFVFWFIVYFCFVLFYFVLFCFFCFCFVVYLFIAFIFFLVFYIIIFFVLFFVNFFFFFFFFIFTTAQRDRVNRNTLFIILVYLQLLPCILHTNILHKHCIVTRLTNYLNADLFYLQRWLNEIGSWITHISLRVLRLLPPLNLVAMI